MKTYSKYVTLETGWKVLKNKTFRWSSPLILNDPFDSQINIFADEEYYLKDCYKDILYNMGIIKDPFTGLGKNETNLKRHIKSRMREIVAELRSLPSQWGLYAKHIRIFCVSETFDNILMWSHYSKDHKGMVLRLKNTRGGMLEDIRAVEYINYMPKYAVSVEDVLEKSDYSNFFFDNLFLKSTVWNYEREWRCFRVASDPNSPLFEDIPFHDRELDSVYLGLNMESFEKNKLLKFIKKEFSRIQVFETVKSTKDFGVAFKRLC